MEAFCIGRFGNPEFEVSTISVFLVEMVKHALPVGFFVELWIVVEAKLDGSADDYLRNDLAVGFCDDFSVNCPRFVV